MPVRVAVVAAAVAVIRDSARRRPRLASTLSSL